MDSASFKFRFKKAPWGKILSFNPEQLNNYRIEARLDFIAILLHQLNKLNGCEIRLNQTLTDLSSEWLIVYNANMIKLPKKLIDVHLWRAVTDYCKNSVNLSAISDYQMICSLLETYYDRRDGV